MDNQIQSLKNKTNSKQDEKRFPAFLISALAHIDDNYTTSTPADAK
ncbi:hypothetical protein [Amylibacter sp. SFDW26]|nr:hypothetical protein [Amylibacter sp. SFDW26]